MKVFQINIFGNLSTGRIAVDIYRTLRENGHDGLFAFARNQTEPDVPHYRIGSKASVCWDGLMTRLTDRAGFYSQKPTERLIEKIREYDPDVVHLHNLHGYYINIERLFDYLRESGKPVVWTLHDCWAFTGHCCHYSAANCGKWKTGCSHCPQRGAYPKSLLLDRSSWNYRRKRELFTSVPRLHLVCVSRWLKNEVGQSFLRDVPCDVIYNGIDLNTFRPSTSDFRQKHGLADKKIVLGVASTWSKNKGLDDFLKLAQMLDDRYRIVLVGLNETERKNLPNNVLGFGRTGSLQELVDIYSAADFFFNASVEETFGLPTAEAMACGTPSIVYDATALPEVISNGCGHVVKSHDLKAVADRLASGPIPSPERCRDAVRPFDMTLQYRKYLELYEKLVKTDPSRDTERSTPVR